MPVHEFLSRLPDIDNLEDLDKSLENLIDRLGLYKYAYFGLAFSSGHPPVAHSNLPKRWVIEYMAENYANIDPIIFEARNRVTPFYWDYDGDQRPQTKKAVAFVAKAKSFGISKGIACPVSGPGYEFAIVIAINDKIPQEEAEKLMYHLQIVAGSYHAAVIFMLNKVDEDRGLALTKREKEVLELLFFNLTREQVGEILGISKETVGTHIKRARHKLNTESTSHTIIEAFRRKLISLPTELKTVDLSQMGTKKPKKS